MKKTRFFGRLGGKTAYFLLKLIKNVKVNDSMHENRGNK